MVGSFQLERVARATRAAPQRAATVPVAKAKAPTAPRGGSGAKHGKGSLPVNPEQIIPLDDVHPFDEF